MNNIKKNKIKGGYAVLELLFYIALFAVLSLVVIDVMITMARSFKETTLYAELAKGGVMMERISREIRQAHDIDSISATNLALDTKDSAGVDKIVEFKFINSDIQFWDAGNNLGDLNPSNIVVTDLVFTQVTTAKGKAVKVFFTIRTDNDSLNRTQDFYNTIVLRGDY